MSRTHLMYTLLPPIHRCVYKVRLFKYRSDVVADIFLERLCRVLCTYVFFVEVCFAKVLPDTQVVVPTNVNRQMFIHQRRCFQLAQIGRAHV